jgi:uncharacterized protein YggU (UPF0235/DUF167 family)
MIDVTVRIKEVAKNNEANEALIEYLADTVFGI